MATARAGQSLKKGTGAFFGDATLKHALLTEIRRHEKADQLVHGTYGGPDAHGVFRGCAVGCALDSLNRVKKTAGATGDHERFPKELGIPIELAYLIDHFFEHLPLAEAQTWPARVIAAMPTGRNLNGIVLAMLQWTILDPVHGWMEYAKTPAQQDTLRTFAGLVAQDWAGQTVTETQWTRIEDALCTSLPEWVRAWGRAWAGARAGAWARAWAGAWAGAWTWGRARAWAGARAQWYVAASEEVLRQLKGTR